MCYCVIKNKKYCDRILTEDIKQMEKGKKKHTGTFVIHVSHCDNATWQGEVTWADANKKKNFRSALELIKLIDGALEVDE